MSQCLAANGNPVALADAVPRLQLPLYNLVFFSLVIKASIERIRQFSPLSDYS